MFVMDSGLLLRFVSVFPSSISRVSVLVTRVGIRCSQMTARKLLLTKMEF